MYLKSLNTTPCTLVLVLQVILIFNWQIFQKGSNDYFKLPRYDLYIYIFKEEKYNNLSDGCRKLGFRHQNQNIQKQRGVKTERG